MLENGRVFRGRALGATGVALGEAVFNTSMTGYQEIVTDLSYAGQIVVMTASHIGNTGVNDEDVECVTPACVGLAVREAARRVSSWRARSDLHDYLARHDIVGIEGIDTRALTRALREGGAQRSAIAAVSAIETEDGQTPEQALLAAIEAHPSMEGLDLARDVTCASTYTGVPGAEGEQAVPDQAHHVVVYDFGIKHNILRMLQRHGCRVTVVPAHTPASEVLALSPDGFFLSNGPGDPAAVTYAIDAVRRLLATETPLFGICLGHQILALALGARTFKLRFGHHGGNHPVQDLSTGKVEITAQNHGFAVDRESLPDGVLCTHINLYDQTVEGIRLAGRAVESVQYHPEASPGPHDAAPFFRRFLEAMTGGA